MPALRYTAEAIGWLVMTAGGLHLAVWIADLGFTKFLSFIGETPRTWFDIICEMRRAKRFRWSK